MQRTAAAAAATHGINCSAPFGPVSQLQPPFPLQISPQLNFLLFARIHAEWNEFLRAARFSGYPLRKKPRLQLHIIYLKNTAYTWQGEQSKKKCFSLKIPPLEVSQRKSVVLETYHTSYGKFHLEFGIHVS
jgi:hypothetical protein